VSCFHHPRWNGPPPFLCSRMVLWPRTACRWAQNDIVDFYFFHHYVSKDITFGWRMEGDIGWTGHLGKILSGMVKGREQADLIAKNCTMNDTNWDGIIMQNWIPPEQNVHCQVQLMRFSRRLGSAVLDNQYANRTSWTELNAPSTCLYQHSSWCKLSTLEDDNPWYGQAHYGCSECRVGETWFHWRTRLSCHNYYQAQSWYDQQQHRDGEHGRLFHALKW